MSKEIVKECSDKAGSFPVTSESLSDQRYHLIKDVGEGQYDLASWSEDTHKFISTGTIKFQKGHVVNHNWNGITNEVLIQLLINRLETLNVEPYKSEHNDSAITYLKWALRALEERQREIEDSKKSVYKYKLTYYKPGFVDAEDKDDVLFNTKEELFNCYPNDCKSNLVISESFLISLDRRNKKWYVVGFLEAINDNVSVSELNIPEFNIEVFKSKKVYNYSITLFKGNLVPIQFNTKEELFNILKDYDSERLHLSGENIIFMSETDEPYKVGKLKKINNISLDKLGLPKVKHIFYN